MPLTDRDIADLVDSRLSGEDELSFCVRQIRQKTGYWQEAQWTVNYAKTQNIPVSRITVVFLEERERKTRFELETAVELLSEELKKVGEANPSLPIHRNGVSNAG